MKYYKLILVLVLMSCFSALSQEKPRKHKVSKGETISEIAEKYTVSIEAIYKLNKKAKGVLKLNSVLLIPGLIVKTEKKHTEKQPEINSVGIQINHEVLPKETLYGIAKQYGTTVAELKKNNPSLENQGLQLGQILIVSASKTADAKQNPKQIPAVIVDEKAVLTKNSPKTNTQISSTPKETVVEILGGLTHEVLQKETKYGIARHYGILVSDLEKANPELLDTALKMGQKLIIPSTIGNKKSRIIENIPNETVVSKSEVVKIIPVLPAASIETVAANSSISIREVLAKETKYSIAREYGITVAELERQNPAIVNKLLVGSKLSIQGKKTNPKNEFTEIIKTETEKIVAENTDTYIKNNPINHSELVDSLIEKASENIGTPYQAGGTSKSGYDCSGLMCSTFDAFDIKLPRSSIEMANIGETVNVDEAQKGDLIFFKTRGGRQINHVGMVVEVCDGEIKFIHSSTSSGVIISSTKEKYYEKKFSQINRVLK